jgi:hypothetical protein
MQSNVIKRIILNMSKTRSDAVQVMLARNNSDIWIIHRLCSDVFSGTETNLQPQIASPAKQGVNVELFRRILWQSGIGSEALSHQNSPIIAQFWPSAAAI